MHAISDISKSQTGYILWICALKSNILGICPNTRLLRRWHFHGKEQYTADYICYWFRNWRINILADFLEKNNNLEIMITNEMQFCDINYKIILLEISCNTEIEVIKQFIPEIVKWIPMNSRNWPWKYKCHIWGISLWQYSKLRSYFLGHGGGGGGVLREKKSVNIKKKRDENWSLYEWQTLKSTQYEITRNHN